MKTRLESDKPVAVSDQDVAHWFVYPDTAFETQTGGVVVVLVDSLEHCVESFGPRLIRRG